MNGLSRRGARYLVLSTIVLSSLAQLLFRIGMQHSNALALLVDGKLSPLVGWLASPAALVVAFGLVLYAVSMLAWICALSQLAVSFAYPLLSGTYVLVYVAAIYWPGLDERASLQQVCGLALIVAGVAVLSRSGQNHGAERGARTTDQG